MNQKIRFCTSFDGVKLAYAISGDGPPLVISASWFTHLENQWRSLTWRPWLEAFSREYTVVRYDSRGCGLSDRQLENVTFDAWVRDFECVVEAAGFNQFFVLGTCLGGPIAMEYAARHPDRVSRLVLYGTTLRGRLRRTDKPKEVEKARLLLESLRLGWGPENQAFVQVWASMFQPGGTFEHMRSWCSQQCVAASAETAAYLLPIFWDLDMTPTLRRIRCPALVAHAERDRVVPIEEGRALAGLIPDCRFVLLDSENHIPLADEPAWPHFLAETRNFLGEREIPYGGANGKLALRDLTARERNVLEGIARGLDNSEIAAWLGLSEKTVRNHITRVFDKIGVEHRYQAIVLARDAGLGAIAGAAANSR
jgi:pimeloyl-ACP methyl ester carboxylesterase/DNA-binding CsgD family transcriptional regulator